MGKEKLSPWVYPGIRDRDRIRALNAFTSLSADLSHYIDICSLAFNVSREDIVSKARYHECVLARHAFSKIVRDRTPVTLDAIGKFINRDHSTIKHSYNQAENLIETYTFFRDSYKICILLLDKADTVKDSEDLTTLAKKIKLIKT